MNPDGAILLLGRTLWIRGSEGWRNAGGLPVNGLAFEPTPALAVPRSRGPLTLIFEPEGLSHARAPGHFSTREQFRESLRNRQRFPALARDDLGWGFELDCESGRPTECHVHSEGVAGLQSLRDGLDQAGLAVSGAWSLWSVLRAAAGPAEPRRVAIIVSGEFTALACSNPDSLGTFFRTWSARRGESANRNIAAVVGELARAQGEGELKTLPLRIYGEEPQCDELIAELSREGPVERAGFDELVRLIPARGLARTADLCRTFPRIVRLDRPILKAAIAAGAAFACITAVATAAERRSAAAFRDEGAAQRRLEAEVLHRAENRRLMASLEAEPDRPRASLPGFAARLAPSLPPSVYLIRMAVDRKGEFQLQGRSIAKGTSAAVLRSALNAAGWSCASVEVSADGVSWMASGVLREADHGA